LLERWSESFPVHGAGPESAQPVNATTYTYLGLDSSSQLIELAIQRTAHLERVAADLLVADLLAPAWRDAVSGRKFDVILLLAVLHHVPGFDNRLALMRALAEHLDHGGKLVVSVWQFADHPRMRRKIVSWDNVGVQPAGLEPGDYLLDWKRGGTGYRYCHQVDMAELNRLAGAAGLELLETFRADGKEGNLSLYGVMNAAT